MKSTSIVRRNNCASDFANNADSAIPALATRISIGCLAAASETAACTAARSETSATTAKWAAPRETVCSRVSRLRPSTVTVPPAFTSVDAMARPMPLPPPVTKAWEERGSPDMRSLPQLFRHLETWIYFILQAFATKALHPHVLEQVDRTVNVTGDICRYRFSYTEVLLASLEPT